VPELERLALYADLIALEHSVLLNSELDKNSDEINTSADSSDIPNLQQAAASLKIKLFLSPVTNASFLLESQVRSFLNTL
jgi:hypothetical protein